MDHLAPSEIAERTIPRGRVESLILAWMDGAVESWHVVEQAELWLEDLGELPTPSTTDPGWTALVVVDDLLSMAPQLHVLREDGLALLAFLNAPPEEAEAAHEALNAYLARVCTPERGRRARQEYFGRDQ